jgi:hypothetical protein
MPSIANSNTETKQEIKDVVRIGGLANSTPEEWTKFHRLETDSASGGLQVGNAAAINTGLLSGALLLAGAYNNSSTTGSVSLYDGDLSGGEGFNLALLSTIRAMTADVTSLTAPRVNIENDFIYDPLDGGTHGIMEEIRGIDFDVIATSGTINNLNAQTVRLRGTAGATVTNLRGLYVLGPNKDDFECDLTNMIGVHVGFDSRATAPIGGTLSNYTGLLIDGPDTNHPVATTALAIDIPAIDLPIRLGTTNKATIENVSELGSLSITSNFAQVGAFDSATPIKLAATVAMAAGSFYSVPAMNFTVNHDASLQTADYSGTITGFALRSNIDVGTIGAGPLRRVGLVIDVLDEDYAQQHSIGINIRNTADGTTNTKYNYGILIDTTAASSNIDKAALGLTGVGDGNGIVFDAPSTLDSNIAPAKIWWDGTDLLCTVAGTNWIINTGTSKP